MDRIVERQCWQACGADGPLRLDTIAPGSGAGESRSLPHPFAVIGRDPKSDLRLDDEAVSQRHAYLQVIEGRVFWYDLASRIGIVQEGSVRPWGWFAPERGPVGIGPFRVGVEGPDPDPSIGRERIANPLAERGPSHWPDAVLEFKDREQGGGQWRLGRVLTLVGRANDCRLKIPDDGISRFHGAFLRTPDGPWIIDLQSREGIRVAGARVRAAPLPHGTILHIGRYRMTVSLVDPSRSAATAPEVIEISTLPPDRVPALRNRGAAPSVRRRPSAPKNLIDPNPGRDLIVESPSAGMPNPLDLEHFVGRLELMQSQMFDQFHQAMMTMFHAFGALQRDQMAQVREELDRIRELTGELQALQGDEGRDRRSSPAPVSTDPDPAPEPAPEPKQAPRTQPPVRESRPLNPGRRASTPPPDPGAESDYHELITRRISQIQGERQGRWKRVLDLIKAGSE